MPCSRVHSTAWGRHPAPDECTLREVFARLDPGAPAAARPALLEALILVAPGQVTPDEVGERGQRRAASGPPHGPDPAGVTRKKGWPDGLRYIAPRVKPSRRHAKKLTEFEKATGWRYQLVVTNIEDLGRAVPGSHHVYFLDTLHRQHAVVEDRVRTEKATGIRTLPFHGYAHNQAWILAANIAADLLAHPQLLGLDEYRELAAAEPETLRATILHIPARLVAHARSRILKIEQTWPWGKAVIEAWEHLGVIPAPA